MDKKENLIKVSSQIRTVTGRLMATWCKHDSMVKRSLALIEVNRILLTVIGENKLKEIFGNLYAEVEKQYTLNNMRITRINFLYDFLEHNPVYEKKYLNMIDSYTMANMFMVRLYSKLIKYTTLRNLIIPKEAFYEIKSPTVGFKSEYNEGEQSEEN